MQHDRQIHVTPQNGWNEEHIAILERELQRAQENGESLRPAFERTALATGRKPNSIRNYYYTTYRAQKGERAGRSFEVFTGEQVHQLLSFMLQAQAEGKSVRRAAMELGKFDHSAMLRCQNKYRSLVKTRPEVVRRVVEELRAQGKAVFDPYESIHGAHCVGADAQQVEKVIDGTWHDLQEKLNRLPAGTAMGFLQGMHNMLDGLSNGSEEKLRQENLRLRQENRGLCRQLEMIRMPIDGDILADGGIANARRAAQRAELFQNTSQELAVFIPKNEENTK